MALKSSYKANHALKNKLGFGSNRWPNGYYWTQYLLKVFTKRDNMQVEEDYTKSMAVIHRVD